MAPEAGDQRRGEARLVLRAQLGDRAALADLLRLTEPWLGPYLARLSGDASLADDLLQDALVLIWRKLRHLDEPLAYRAWVYRLATRNAWRTLKKRSRHAVGSLDALPIEAVSPDPGDLPDEAEIERLRDGISALPPNSREVAVLHYWQGQSIRQTAAILGISGGTAKSRLHYALAVLRRRLAAEGDIRDG